MNEGWNTKTSKGKTIWHFYRKGTALCNTRNYCLDVDKLKLAPALSTDGKSSICKTCREKWSLK